MLRLASKKGGGHFSQAAPSQEARFSMGRSVVLESLLWEAQTPQRSPGSAWLGIGGQ